MDIPQSAKLLWRPIGETPQPADFDDVDATAWTDGAEAMGEAARLSKAGGRSDQPWIRVETTIYSPEQIKALQRAEIERRTGEDEAMQGDQPWE